MSETTEIQDWLSARELESESHTADPALVIDESLQSNDGMSSQTLPLDERHTALLRELLQRPSWSLLELRAVTSRAGLMPLACVARLNEWATDTYGDLLLEMASEQSLNVNINLKQRMQL